MGDHCNDTSECTLSEIQDNSIGDTIPSDHILDSTQDLDVNLGASMGPLDCPTDAHTLEILHLGCNAPTGVIWPDIGEGVRLLGKSTGAMASLRQQGVR